jgi:hypothetical protein
MAVTENISDPMSREDNTQDLMDIPDKTEVKEVSQQCIIGISEGVG